MKANKTIQTVSECSTRYVYDSAQPSPVEWQDIDPVLPVGLANQGSAAHRGYFRLPDTNTGGGDRRYLIIELSMFPP